MANRGIWSEPLTGRAIGSITVEALSAPAKRARKEKTIRFIFLLAALVSIAISILIVLSLVREASVFA